MDEIGAAFFDGAFEGLEGGFGFAESGVNQGEEKIGAFAFG